MVKKFTRFFLFEVFEITTWNIIETKWKKNISKGRKKNELKKFTDQKENLSKEFTDRKKNLSKEFEDFKNRKENWLENREKEWFENRKKDES